jgi:NAD/NADP transhydrogenase beta subunit
MGTPVDAKRFFWITLSVTIGAISVTGGLVAFSFYCTHAIKDFIDLMAVSLANFHFVSISCMFILSVYTIYVRFSTLNTLIWYLYIWKEGWREENVNIENKYILGPNFFGANQVKYWR